MIFDKRVSYKPFEYGHITTKLIDAMWQSHWTHNEFSFTKDVQDFRTQITPEEQELVKKTILLISQVEVAVKSYWSNIGKLIPKPEVADMGAVFGGVEVIHSRAYSHILEVLGLNDEFNTIMDNDVIKNRVTYLTKYADKIYEDDKKNIAYSLCLFTLFTENVSLFSQFFILLGFNRFRGVLNDTANIVQYTSKEENCLIEGTEVLTPTGWTDLRDINIGDPIYQYEENGDITKTNVLNKVVNDFEGNLLSFSKTNYRTICTPDHNMIYYNKSGELVRKKASDLKIHNQTYLPHGGTLNNNGTDILTPEEQLRIVIQADGSTKYWTTKSGERRLRGKNGGYTHQIHIKKQRKVDRLLGILSNLDIEYKIEDKGDLGLSFHIRYNNDFDYKEFDWIDLDTVSSIWCKSFCKELSEWDGYNTGTLIAYSSTNKRTIDMAQTIGILAGYKTGLGVRSDKRGYKDTYKLSFQEKPLVIKSHSIKKEEVPYKGKVYCVEVPSHNIITRLGTDIFITGNCHAEGGLALLKTIKDEYPEVFDQEFIERIKHESKEAIESEISIINWILGDYETEWLSVDILSEYLQRRMDESLVKLGIEPIFVQNKLLDDKVGWMEEEVYASALTDFFVKKPIDYAKANKSYSEHDLF